MMSTKTLRSLLEYTEAQKRTAPHPCVHNQKKKAQKIEGKAKGNLLLDTSRQHLRCYTYTA